MFDFRAIDDWFERKYGKSPDDLHAAKELGTWDEEDQKAYQKYLQLHQKIVQNHSLIQPLVNLVLRFDPEVIEVMRVATPMTAATGAFERVFTSLKNMRQAMLVIGDLPAPKLSEGNDDNSERTPIGRG